MSPETTATMHLWSIVWFLQCENSAISTNPLPNLLSHLSEAHSIPVTILLCGSYHGYTRPIPLCQECTPRFQSLHTPLVSESHAEDDPGVYMCVLECEMSVQINAGLLCTKFIMMATIRKRPDQAFQH